LSQFGSRWIGMGSGDRGRDRWGHWWWGSVVWDTVLTCESPVDIVACDGFRLPTEAEWEYAARAQGSHYYAGSNNLSSVGWYSGNSGSSVQDVCGKATNGFGLCDMTGNVSEWVNDWYASNTYDLDNYAFGHVVDPTGPLTGTDKVRRGGHFMSDSNKSRVVDRAYLGPADLRSTSGFRLVRSHLP